MSFTHIAEVLQSPLRKFTEQEKQFAVSIVVILLWKLWDQRSLEWVKHNNVKELYHGAFQREELTDQLMKIDTGVFGR